MRVGVAVLLVAAVVAAAGCGGGSSATPPAPPASAATTSAPPALPENEYETVVQNTLARASATAETALAGPSAKRFAAAKSALLRAAERLSGLRVPVNARAGNALLVRGLEAWAGQLRSAAAAYVRCRGASPSGPRTIEQGFERLERAGYTLRRRSRRGLGACSKPAPPMGRTAYLKVVKHELGVSGPTIDRALGARTNQEVVSRVATARKALRKAAERLDSLRPPPAAAKANDLLVLGLDQWSNEVELAAAAMFSRLPETITSVSNAMRGPGTLQRAARELRRAGFPIKLS